jgi:hypothetical protein
MSVCDNFSLTPGFSPVFAFAALSRFNGLARVAGEKRFKPFFSAGLLITRLKPGVNEN